MSRGYLRRTLRNASRRAKAGGYREEEGPSRRDPSPWRRTPLPACLLPYQRSRSWHSPSLARGGAGGGARGGRPPGGRDRWAAREAGRPGAAAAAREKLSRPEREPPRDPEPPQRAAAGAGRDHWLRSPAGRLAAGGGPGAWDSRQGPRVGAAPRAGGGRPELPGRRMRFEGAAPGPVAPLCWALSLVLGALLGRGKVAASVAPALWKFLAVSRSPGGGSRRVGVLGHG